MSTSAALSSTIAFERWPQDDDELWEWVYTIWGVKISRARVCQTHCAPFEAFADAFFARYPVTVWKASRGFGGKSSLLAILGLTEQVILGAQVVILGGSGRQSRQVHETMIDAWAQPRAPRGLLIGDPSQMRTRLSNGAWATALPASQKSVRGPHPQRLRLDEVDEMALPILNASLGQPLRRGKIPTQIVASSTHQYADGTMAEMLKRVSTHGYHLHEWCFRENMEPGGWLAERDIQEKRGTVTGAMWTAEYEGQEPNPENRAIMPEAVTYLFQRELGEYAGAMQEYIEHEPPVPGARYAHGADWAKSVDFTELVTLRVDVTPARLVAYERMQRLPWPQMVARLDARLTRYGLDQSSACHDKTGLGDVVDGYLTVPVEGIVLVGRTRSDLFSHWISAIERHAVISPYIESLAAQYRFASIDDLYGSGHPPDGFVAGAMAWQARGGQDSGVSF